ncbi:DUF6308 family protein [Corynebacterium lubricantis]|uniref:DUF6308 family protein n=1 Tax=Corynebacterium lubricantis TaxID=541095 RepID=UPI00037B0408|nr:DUF6308 family protein [Corynebacterium lubricantis]
MQDHLVRLPRCLEGTKEQLLDENSQALQYLRTYYQTRLDPENYSGKGWYAGAFFDQWNFDSVEVENPTRFTAQDIAAVQCLSISFKARTVAEILYLRNDDLNSWLEKAVDACAQYSKLSDIPPSVTDYRGKTKDVSDDEWAPFVLDKKLREIDDVDVVTASKLIARKLPHIYTIWDKKVTKLAGVEDRYMRPLQITLQNDPSIEEKLEALRLAAGLPISVSLIRIYDVLAWMEQTHDPISSQNPIVGNPG